MSSAQELPALPEGWEWRTIGDVCNVGPKVNTRALPDSMEVSFVPMKNVAELSGEIDVSLRRFLRDVRKGYTVFQDGDVLFAKITPCMENGKVAIARDLHNGLGFGSTEFHVLRPSDVLLAEYLFHYIVREEFRRDAQRNMTGTAGQLRVPGTFLNAAPIPIPTIETQKEIVATLDDLFSRLDAGVAALQEAAARAKRYRAAVLKAAVEGRLTERWRAEQAEPPEPAAKLLERILAERRARWEAEELAKMAAKGKTPKDDAWKKKYKEPAPPDTTGLPELPEGWCWGTIDQVVEFLDHMRRPVNKEDRMNRIGAIPYYGANGQVGWIDDYLFDESLVLVVEDETFTGREKPFSYVINGKAWVNNHAHVLRPVTPISAEFLNYSLSYYPFTALTTGTTGRRKLTKSAMQDAPLPLPPFHEQSEIVANVERLLTIIDATGRWIDSAITSSTALRQSILKRAFEGRLGGVG